MGEKTLKTATRFGYVVDTDELHAFGVADKQRAFARAQTGTGFYLTIASKDENKANRVLYLDINNAIPADELKALKDLNNGNEKQNKGFVICRAYATEKGCNDKKALEEFDFENWYLNKDGNAVCVKMRFIVMEMR